MSSSITLLLVVFALIGYDIWREIEHGKQLAKLHTMLFEKTLPETKKEEEKRIQEEESLELRERENNENFLSLDQVDHEQLLKAVEKEEFYSDN